MNTKSIAVIVGHTPIFKGAYSSFLGIHEFDYNLSVAKHLKCYGYDVFTHKPMHRWYTQRQRNTAKKTTAYDYVFELHFNSFKSEKAQGSECLYFHRSKIGKRSAEIISSTISNEYSTINRGAKELSNKKQRGYGFVHLQKPPAVIIEPFFGSNHEALKFRDAEKYADCLHRAFKRL